MVIRGSTRRTLAICITIFVVRFGYAQPIFTEVSIGVSSIRTTHPGNTSRPLWTAFPQIEVSRTLTKKGALGTQFGVGLLAGAWSDGVDLENDREYCNYHSYNGFVMGVRAELGSYEVLPVKFFVGASRHFLTGELVHRKPRSFPRPIAEDPGLSKVKERYNTIDIGMRLSMPVHERLLLGVEIQRAFSSIDQEKNDNLVRPRMRYGIIMTYRPAQ